MNLSSNQNDKDQEVALETILQDALNSKAVDLGAASLAIKTAQGTLIAAQSAAVVGSKEAKASNIQAQPKQICKTLQDMYNNNYIKNSPVDTSNRDSVYKYSGNIIDFINNTINPTIKDNNDHQPTINCLNNLINTANSRKCCVNYLNTNQGAIGGRYIDSCKSNC